jgi:REP element-mobilizing transposase RayT
VLARSEVRACVREGLLRFDGQRLRVHAAVIMPNHVHALLEPLPFSVRDTGIPACASDAKLTSNPQAGMPVPPASQPNPQAGMPVSPPQQTYALSDLLHGIKGASARAANRLLGRTGAFWMDESYDRIVRDQAEYVHFTRYLRANPTKTRLAADQFWLWPSESDTGIPACASTSGTRDTGIPACDSVSDVHPNPQARMPVSPPTQQHPQAGMPVSRAPCPPPPTS